MSRSGERIGGWVAGDVRRTKLEALDDRERATHGTAEVRWFVRPTSR